MSRNIITKGDQGWCSGESAHPPTSPPPPLPTTWPCCWLSLLLVLVFGTRISLRVRQFSFLHKNQRSEFQIFDLETIDKEPLCGCPTANSHLFIFIFYYTPPLAPVRTLASCPLEAIPMPFCHDAQTVWTSSHSKIPSWHAVVGLVKELTLFTIP